MLAKFWGLNRNGLYLSLEKEKEHFCVVFTYSSKQSRESRKFHVAVLQRQLRNVQKSLMHVQSCCFANMNLLPFNCLCCRRRSCCRCLNPLLLWSRNFATMVMWCHTSPLYWISICHVKIDSFLNFQHLNIQYGANWIYLVRYCTAFLFC